MSTNTWRDRYGVEYELDGESDIPADVRGGKAYCPLCAAHLKDLTKDSGAIVCECGYSVFLPLQFWS